MNLQSIHQAVDLSHGAEIVTAGVIAMSSMAVYAVFTPYVAHDQARQLVLSLGGLGKLFVLSKTERVRKKVAHVKDLHWSGFHGSAA